VRKKKGATLDMVSVGITLHRNVTVGDLAAAAAAIGRPFLAGGDGAICLAHPSGDRDVRVSHDLAMGVSAQLDSFVDQGGCVTAPVDTVFLLFQQGIQTYTTTLDFRSHDAAPFEVAEMQRVLDVVCVHFGAAPAVIMNRHLLLGAAYGPVASDSADDINVFHGYDVKKAVERFTLPSIRWPNETLERLFLCWRCITAKYCGAFYFRGSNPGSHFYNLLGSRVIANTNGCCKQCTDEMASEPRGVNPRRVAAGAYTLEALAVPGAAEPWEHVGYMDVKFRSWRDACHYYEVKNPHMPRISATGVSECDPVSRRVYVVRQLHHPIGNPLPPFR